MDGVKDAEAEVRRLSPQDGHHYYFGYHDIPSFSEGDEKHLCNKVDFRDRLPVKNDTCELGTLDVKNGTWKKFAATTAFNFQQGCMLQWDPKNPGTDVIYNVRDGNEFKAVVQNIYTGNTRTLPAALANVSPDGKWGLAVNMKRLYEFRPCCGYAGVQDPWHNTAQPKDDGIYLINMETGEMNLILNYHRIGRLFNIDPDEKLVVNHVTFGPDNNRFLFLVRNVVRPPQKWSTSLGTIDRAGENFYPLNRMSMVSHYNWRDKNHLLVWADIKNSSGMFVITDQKDESVQLDSQFFNQDIHCIYSPDKKYILGDAYPDAEGFRRIYLYNMQTGKGRMLLRVKSDPAAQGDIRCDLHTRWSRNGKLVSFDSTHEGFRGLYLIELGKL